MGVSRFSGENYTEMIFNDFTHAKHSLKCRRKIPIEFLHEKSSIVHFWPLLRDNVPEFQNM